MWKKIERTLEEIKNKFSIPYDREIEEIDCHLKQHIPSIDNKNTVNYCRMLVKNIYYVKRKNKNIKDKRVPWSTFALTLLRKKVNAYRRIYQRTYNGSILIDDRKRKYVEEKTKMSDSNKNWKTKILATISQYNERF